MALLPEPTRPLALPPQETTAQDRAAVRWERRAGWAWLALALAPPVLTIWLAPAFVTQDGPAHLYNAHILAESLRADSSFRDVFAIRWSPLPNWLGHLLEMGLVAALPPLVADRLTTTIPLIGLAAATFWFKGRVSGNRGDLPAALLSAMIGLNVCWLFGFTSFLLGACLFPITLGVWWGARDKLGLRHALVIAGLVVLGYFAHVVSLGLTAGGLMVLAVLTPGDRRARLGWTLAGLIPLLVLVPVYRGLMSRGGPLAPIWGHFRHPGSPEAWRDQLGWVDPISLGRKVAFPFVAGESSWWGLASPVALLTASLVVIAASGGLRAGRERLGWMALSLVLIVGGFFTPDTLGASHGNYLPQRIVLLGLVALAASLDFGRAGKLATGLLAIAVAVQTLAVMDYARESSARVGPFVRASAEIGRNRRVGTLLIGIQGRFRANPLLHADSLLGVGTDHVVWSDYETIHYYFPVQFRPDVLHPPARDFEAIALMADPGDAQARARLWSSLLEDHHGEIELLAVWGSDPALETINRRWFATVPIYADGPLRVFAKAADAGANRAP